MTTTEMLVQAARRLQNDPAANPLTPIEVSHLLEALASYFYTASGSEAGEQVEKEARRVAGAILEGESA